jgi:hypothetical protein
MKFVLVNGRIPSPQTYCVLCCEPIRERYLREIRTRLPYCDHDCYAAHCSSAIRQFEGRSKVS